MDKGIINILSSYGCKYMADDYKEMIEEIIAFAKKQEEAINYTCCSTQLNDKYGEDFIVFLKNHTREQPVESIYWYKGTGYTNLDELYKKWLKMTKPLIV